jgi:hypothetical protein
MRDHLIYLMSKATRPTTPWTKQNNKIVWTDRPKRREGKEGEGRKRRKAIMNV